MKRLLYILFCLAFFCNCGNRQKIESTDNFTQYGDTLIGVFNGFDIDTLIAEPIDSINANSEDDYDKFHLKWRIYTTKGTVKDMIITNKTIGISFVKEGDLDNNGTDEWGYISEWPTSQWMSYNTYTFSNGEWKSFLNSIPIWLSHINLHDSVHCCGIEPEEILNLSTDKKHIQVKFSDIRNDGGDFLLIDTIISVESAIF